MKKWISLLFVAALMLCFQAGWSSAAAKKAEPAAAPVPKLFLDGKALTANAPPALVNASVMVPIRSVAEHLGYKVGWDTKKKQVSVKEGATTILMTLNNPKATVNGNAVTMTEPPLMQSDTTLIPLRFVSETLGLQIFWDNGSKSVFLFSDLASENDGNGDGAADGGTDTDSGSTDGTEPDPGTDAGTGADTGSQPDPDPADGGLIGVVDGTDGTGTTDGATDGTVDPDGGGATDGTGEPGGSASPDPQIVPAHLHQIRYEPDAVVITYDGSAVPATHVLSGPDRIVIDIPNGSYADDFTAGFSPGIIPDFTTVNTGIPAPGLIVEMPTDGHDFLSMVRYSQYQSSPDTARIVLDLNRPMGYEILNDATNGELRFVLKESQAEPVKNGYTVVLDAGHGGSDPGARSVTGKWEKNFNLSVVKKVQAILAKESKINLVLTRHSDTYPSLDDRVNLANSLKADMFVSVHANSWKPGINGTETYYSRSDSLSLAKLFHKNMLAATNFKDNGVRSAGFKVIKYTKMPAVLLEVGYLSYAQNEKQMFNDAFQNRVAASIAASMKQYFKIS